MFKELQTLLKSRHTLAHALTKKHLYALGLLLILLFVSYAILQSAIAQQRDDAYLVNISGKQRMLAQRIVSLSQNIASRKFLGRDYLEASEELKLSLQELDFIHKSLRQKALHTEGFSLNRRSPLYEVYFGSWNLAIKLESFLGEGVRLLESEETEETLFLSQNLLEMWEGDQGLLGVLELGTLTFQLESEHRIDTFQKTALGIILLIVVVLFLEALFVIRPAILELALIEEKCKKCLNKRESTEDS